MISEENEPLEHILSFYFSKYGSPEMAWPTYILAYWLAK